MTFLYVAFVVIASLGDHVDAGKNCTPPEPCADAMIIKAWQPVDNIGTGDRIGRAVVYMLLLCYMFLGVSIIADRFMASIEVITSQEREITIKKKSGEIFTVTVRIWNETVSNLTLMALGSSAPEILLSIIEVCGRGFRSGELGPNTIVGSAAFNLFMIIAICIYVIPSPEIRRQQHLRVFFVTASWSLFAYIWLYIIIAVSSPGVVEIWEGLLTFAFFPLTVLTAYIADRKLLPHKLLGKRYRATATKMEDVEMPEADGHAVGYKLVPQEDMNPEVKALEDTRREFMEIFRELRKKHPNMDINSLQQMAEFEMLNRGPKSRAFYRVQATRKLVGGGNIVKKKLEKEHHKSMEALAKVEDLKVRYTTKIYFDPGHYTVLENVGCFDVIVTRDGGPPGTTISVDYRTEDGTASAGSDYIAKSGTLTLYPEDEHGTIPIEIIDDDVFEEDEHFYIHLENLRVKTKDGLQIDPSKLGGMPMAELVPPLTATVMILDDDHAGVFAFEKKLNEVNESAGEIHVKVIRHSGARGKVIIPYKCIDGTAVGGRDYDAVEGQLIFENDEVEQYVTIGIVDDQEYEKDEEFFIHLGEPIWAKKLSDQSKVIDRYLRKQRLKQQASGGVSSDDAGDRDSDSGVDGERVEVETDADKVADLGKPRIGDIGVATIKIKESMEFKNVVDKMIKTANVSLVLGTSSWREQFTDAITVSAGDDDGGDDDGGGESDDEDETLPSLSDYVMHFITLPWKLLFAFIPPTDYWGGWACFIVSILGIGLLTAFIGDIATHFGCTVGLKDAVTAISLVALGTSVPDTFASKVAAVQDKYADSSIGNVTGSNAVNVFLGIGIAWSMCAIYHAIVGTKGGFAVNPGTLAYSVCIFCAEAVICFGLLVLKRWSVLGGGELGGPAWIKYPSALFLALLWVIYLTLSALESYCVIEGF